MVFPDGETEVLQTHVAIGKAKAQGLDLVLVSPTANPPVAKVMDYGEYTYLEKKKKNEAKKKQHRIEVKEVKFRPNTDQHDYNFKKNHAIRFPRGRQQGQSGCVLSRTRDHALRPGAASSLRI